MEWNSFREKEERTAVLFQKFLIAQSQKEKESAFLQKLKEASPHYIDEDLESLVFLERAGLKVHKPLRFVEGAIRRNRVLQEVEERQEGPVLMDAEDLKKALVRIERVEIPPHRPAGKAPQLLIHSLDLRKVALSSSENVFEVSMKLIKREGLR